MPLDFLHHYLNRYDDTNDKSFFILLFEFSLAILLY